MLLWTITTQRFTISYLTGKRLVTTTRQLQIVCFLNWEFDGKHPMFRMFLNYLVFYVLSGGLIASCCLEGGLYFFNKVRLSIRLDMYSVSFYTLLGVVRGCVGIWSFYYLRNAEAYPRFIFLLISFITRMAALILFSNLYITLIGWDGLGVTSFLLVIFYKNRKSLGSGIITALTNRLGDALLVCLLGLLIVHVHTTILVLMVCLRLTKRAQIPFSAWLPAAIAAPTPVSALVHSSTLVTAGVYVLLRYCHVDAAALLCIGSCTILVAGFCACAERDFKKVVALRTLSQLGVIMVSLGANAKSYCFFHLMSHALFKALLFICIGTCIHVVYGTQDYRRFNKLSSMNLSILCTVSNLSLMGFVFTSGFYRKDYILEVLYYEEAATWALFFFLLGIGLTTCYSVKMLSSSFLMGTLTGARSRSLNGHRWQVKCPLYLLRAVSLVFGSTVNNYCRVISLPITYSVKMYPLRLISLGIISGYLVSRLNRALLRSMVSLTPLTQIKSTYVHVELQIIDKGWIESCTRSVSFISSAIYHHYSPYVSIGLCSILMYIII